MMSPVEILGRLDQRSVSHEGSRSAVERRRPCVRRSSGLMTSWTTRTTLVDRLSVFSGDFDLEAVIALAVDAGHDPFDVVDHLGSLVAKCLVEHTESAPARRGTGARNDSAYAAERLDADGDTDDAPKAASYYLALGGELLECQTVRDFDALERLRVGTRTRGRRTLASRHGPRR